VTKGAAESLSQILENEKDELALKKISEKWVYEDTAPKYPDSVKISIV
jgi:hypothetical protein